MEGFSSKDAAKNLAAEIKHLASEKYSLEEELIQCKADKDFVWTLWKRLQTEKPDMGSVISMVVAREKEKAEKKDQKILEILRLKDEKILEMRKAMDDDRDEMKMNKERLHGLLIENDELKQKIDEQDSEMTGKLKEMENRTREIEEKNQYLSQLIKAYQEEKETKDKELKDNLDQIDNERNSLKSQIKYLEGEVEKLNEDRTSLGEAMKTNATLKDQIKEMENILQQLTTKSESYDKQYDEAITALKVREKQLQEETKATKFMTGELRDKDKELIRLRAETADLRSSHNEALSQVREQTAVIEQLQGMQDQMYTVMEDHKQSYERELATLQKEIVELQRMCSAYHLNEDRLRNEIGALKQSKASDFEDLIAKDQLIDKLEQSVEQAGRAHSSPQKRARFEEPCERCKELEEKLESLETEHEDLSDVLREKTRRISSLEKTIKSSFAGKATKTSADATEDVTRDKSSPEDVTKLQQQVNRLEKRIGDLKTLLQLKESEVSEVHRAHNQRQQRYRLLKENYGLVRNQLSTFESEPVERTPPERPPERALRHEDSDGVWNELTHYRGEYEKLDKERHDVLEELDVLRVQHANDLTTIQELRLCLEEEKEGLLKRLEEESKKDTDSAKESKKSAVLKEEIDALRQSNEDKDDIIAGLKDEIVHLKQEMKYLAEDNARIKLNTVNLEQQLQSASSEIEAKLLECENLKETLRTHERRRSRSPAKSPKQARKSEHDDDDEFIRRQAKDIDMYDQQLKKIAEKILQSPSQQNDQVPGHRPGRSPHRHDRTPHRIDQSPQKADRSPPRKESQSTQTLEKFHTADFSSFVDFDQADHDEEVGVIEVDAREKFARKGNSAHTPKEKKVMSMKKTPGKGEWSSMRQRILSLTQQVSAIRNAKDKAVKALNEGKAANESLQAELNTVLQRLQVSKNSVQTLTEDLKKCMKEKDELMSEKENVEQVENEGELIRRKTEERLKITSNELSRLNALVKTLRNDKTELKEKLTESQQRCSRAEKDVAQKKTYVEEMKAKIRKAQDAEERYVDIVKDLEERIKRLTERDTQKKLQLDSVKRQLEAETKEKEKLRSQYLLTVEENKKKTRMLADSRSLRGKAEMAVNEMEAAATEQLQTFAHKSEAALKSLRTKLESAEERIEEYQALIKTLTDELLADNERTCFKIAQYEEQRMKEERNKPSSKQARDLACSILDMTTDDLDEFMKDNESATNQEQIARKKRAKEWKNTIDVLLNKEVPFAVPLIEVLLDIIEGSKVLGGRLIQLSNKTAS